MNYFACYEAIRMPHEAHFIGYGRGPECVRSELRLDGRDAVRRRRHLLGLLVRDLDVEGLLDGHDELHGVEGVRAEVLREGRGRHHLTNGVRQTLGSSFSAV